MTTTTTSRHDDGGFALIELLIVILILGFLAGIALFSAGSFQERARDACVSNNQRIEMSAGVIFDLATVEGLYEMEPGDCQALGGHGVSTSERPEDDHSSWAQDQEYRYHDNH